MDLGAPIFFQRVVRSRIFREAPDEAIVRRQSEEILPPVFDQLELLYVRGGEADPESLTIGAIAIWSTFVSLAHAGQEVDRERWPGLVDFLERFGRHAPLTRLVEEERALLASA